MLISDSLFQHEVAVSNSSRRLPKMDTPGRVFGIGIIGLYSWAFSTWIWQKTHAHLRMEMLIPSIIQIQFNARLQLQLFFRTFIYNNHAWLRLSHGWWNLRCPTQERLLVETAVGKLVFQPETLEILEAGWPKWKMTESKIPPPSSFWWSSLDCHLEWSHRESEKRHRALGSLDVEPIGAFWTRTMAYISIPHELFRVKNSNLNATKPMDPISALTNCCRVSPCLKGHNYQPTCQRSPGHVHPNSHTSTSPW